VNCCRDFFFAKILKESKFVIMAKAVKKKSAKEASNTFHNIIGASVKGNPKPIKKTAKKTKS
jgi:hypothetical protein